jgi:hypothetical protein
MSNIAVGIGLSGKEQTDLRGLEYLVGAEKDMAGQREAKRKSEEAAKQKLIDDIFKNTAFKQQFDNKYFQKEFERDAAARMAKIIEPMMSGQTDYANLAVMAHNEISALERANRQRKTEDSSMSALNKAVLAKPNEVFIADPRTIDGKVYNSPQQALNALAETPDAGRKVAEAWGNANWYWGANEDEELGRMSMMFNPEMALTMNAVEEGTKFLKSTGVFNVPGSTYDITQDRTTVKYQGLRPDDDSIFRTNAHLFNDPRFGNIALLSAYTDAREQNPNLNYNDWISGIDVVDTVNAYADSVMNTLRNYEGDKMQVSSTKPEPKESGPSSGSIFGSDKVEVFKGEDVIKAQAAQPWETGQEGSQSYQYLAVAPIQLKKSVLMNTDIKAGTLYWDQKAKDGKGELRAPKGFESSQKVVPHELVVMSDGQKERPYIRFLLAGERKENEDPIADIKKIGLSGSGGGEDKFTSKSFESFYVPATDDNLKRLAAATETGIDKWKSLVSELEKTALQGRRSASSGGAFINQGGGVAPQQNPASGVIGKTANKAAPSGGITADEFNKKWATLKSGQSLVGPDGKTYKKP